MHSPHQRWLGAPQLFRNTSGQLLCLPTTCSLGQWFKSAARPMRQRHAAYQLIYLHDDDLLILVERSMLRCFFVQAPLPLRRRVRPRIRKKNYPQS